MKCLLPLAGLALLGTTIASKDAPLPSPRVDGPRYFSMISLAEARELAGERRKFYLWLWTPMDQYEGNIIYGCWSADKVERAVWFVPGTFIRDDEKIQLVEGQLRIIRQRLDGEEWWEIRIEDADVIQHRKENQ